MKKIIEVNYLGWNEISNVKLKFFLHIQETDWESATQLAQCYWNYVALTYLRRKNATVTFMQLKMSLA